ncbi:MAG: hypothetical protein ACNFW9_02115 [Candidatus Kerfeldbacteria bacterium]
MKKNKKNSNSKTRNKFERFKNWFKLRPILRNIIIGIILGIIFLIANEIRAGMRADESSKEITESFSILTNTIINDEELDELKVYDFEEFTIVGDIRFDKNSKVMSLGHESNFAYFLSKMWLSEHATIKTKFIPLTEAADYYIIVENVFQIIIGDGDRRAISLKSFVGGGDWEYEQPVNRAVDLSPRYYLDRNFPINNFVIVEIDVSAKVIEGNKRTVKLDIRFTDENGDVYNTLDLENITWEFVVEKSTNDIARYGVGLIDPSGQHMPKVNFEYLHITEKQQ